MKFELQKKSIHVIARKSKGLTKQSQNRESGGEIASG